MAEFLIEYENMDTEGIRFFRLNLPGDFSEESEFKNAVHLAFHFKQNNEIVSVIHFIAN